MQKVFLKKVLRSGDIVISIRERDKKGVFRDASVRLEEGRKDRGYVLSSSITSYKSEDGRDIQRATVTLTYICEVFEGDKFTGGHGNKGTISRSYPKYQMFYVKNTGEVIDFALNPTGVMVRNIA